MSSGGPRRSLRILATAAGYFFGGLFTLSLASSVAMRSLQSFMEAKRVSSTRPISSFFLLGLRGRLQVFFVPLRLLAEEGGSALCSLQRKRLLRMQTMQGEIHHRLVSPVRSYSYQPLSLPNMRGKQVGIL